MREEGEKTMIEEGEAGRKGGKEEGRGERGHPTISRAQSLP